MEALNINQLRECAGRYAKDLKVFKDAEDFLRSVEEVQGVRAGLMSDIEDLKKTEAVLLERNNSISSLYEAAEKKAQQIVLDAEAGAFKYEAELQAIKKEHEDAVNKEKANLESVKAETQSKMMILNDTTAKVAAVKEELAELEKLKDAAKKVLGV